jgi:DNA polymerase III epsilon subunit-like protein
MVGSELLRYQDFSYIVWDLETEGLNLLYTRPWQISWIVVENGKIVKQNDRFPYWPDLKISAKAAQVTRFSWSNYQAKGEDPKKVFQDFEKDISNPKYKTVGHNILNYDVFIYNVLRRTLGCKTDWSMIDRSYDTLALFRSYRENIPYKKDRPLVAWMYSMLDLRTKNTSLRKAAEEFNIAYDPEKGHDGLYDCGVNHQVFQSLIRKVEV